MAFKLPNLPYAYDALEPYIDQRTMDSSRQTSQYVRDEIKRNS